MDSPISPSPHSESISSIAQLEKSVFNQNGQKQKTMAHWEESRDIISLDFNWHRDFHDDHAPEKGVNVTHIRDQNRSQIKTFTKISILKCWGKRRIKWYFLSGKDSETQESECTITRRKKAPKIISYATNLGFLTSGFYEQKVWPLEACAWPVSKAYWQHLLFSEGTGIHNEGRCF